MEKRKKREKERKRELYNVEKMNLEKTYLNISKLPCILEVR